MKRISVCCLAIILSPLPSFAGGMSGMISNQVTRAVNQGISKNLFDNLIIPQLKVKNSSGRINTIKLSRDERFLSLLLEDGSSRIWDLKVGVQRPVIKSKNGPIKSIYPSNRQNLLYVNDGHSINGIDFLTANHRHTLHSQNNTIDSFAVSHDSSTLITNSGNTISAWNTKTKQSTWTTVLSDGEIKQILINETNQFVAILIQQSSLFSSSNQLEIRDLKTGALTQTLKIDNADLVFFEFTHPKLIEAFYNNGDVIHWNIETGVKSSPKNMGTNILAANKASNGVTAYVTSEDTLTIVNQQGIKSHLTKKGIGHQAPVLLANGRKLMTATAEGKMILWDVANKTELLQLITTQQGWTVIDNAGRFDSSEKGMLNVSWEAANKDIPLDSFSDKYYEPGLLATALENERYLNKKPTTIRKGITLPPQLNVVVTNINNQPNLAELTVEIYGQGGGIKDINLYHNGKVLPKKSFIVDDKAFNVDKKERRTLKVRITPTGGDNTIKVTALNKMDIQGQSKEISFNGAGQIKKPVLHVVTVAVDKYKDSRLNLDYSVSDASSISKDFNNRDISVFGSIKQQKLYNAAATKKAIMAELIKISNGAENDVLAVYAAGHGIAVDGEWYFLPHETTLEADLQYYTRVGISASEFSAVFIDSKIQHIILMIDACYSGATVDSFRRLQNAQRHFSRNMSKSIGITVIAATRKDQEAAELSELGHGLFTFVLSKGMNGDADSMPKNHKISAHELASFSIKTIPSFSTKFLGAAQEPTAFTMGKDFSLLRAN